MLVIIEDAVVGIDSDEPGQAAPVLRWLGVPLTYQRTAYKP